MLDAMRKRATSWIVKAFLGVIILSFAVWGIGDMVGGGRGEPPIATVGGTEIRSQDVRNAFRQRVETFESQLGTRLDREQAAGLGLLDQALEDVIGRRLLDLGAANLGLRVPDEVLRRQVVENPIFHGPAGFDRQRFQNILLASGMSEEGYLAALRQESMRAALVESIAGNVEAPEALARKLYEHRNERRGGRALVVEAATITEVAEPDDEALAAHIADNEQRFTTPEYRAITAIVLQPEDVAGEITISEDDLQRAYEAQRGAYRTPERRHVEQVLAGDAELAAEVAERLRTGADLASIEADLGVVGDDLGEVRAGELPANFDRAIFALDGTGVSDPVDSPFGWHVFRIVEITPASEATLAEVRDELEADLREREALDRLPALANALDDELAGGAAIEDAADALGLEVRQVAAIDAQGRDEAGNRPDALPEWQELVRTAFESPPQETSLVLDAADGGYFVLRVDAITDPRLPTVDEVREEAREGWRAARRLELARERADELARRAREVTSFDSLAEGGHGRVRPIEPLTRRENGSDQGLSAQAVQALFATEPGRSAAEPVRVQGGYAVIATDEIIPADADADPQAVARLRDQLTDEMREDVLQQFERALRRSYPVEVNQRALRDIVGDVI